MTILKPVSAGSPLYVPPGRPIDGVVSGVLLASTANPPATVTLAAVLAGQGWAVLAGPIKDAALPAFIAAAQIWFRGSARRGVCLGWFTAADQPATGLAGWALPLSDASSLATSVSFQCGNLALGLPFGTTLALSADGTALTFTGAHFPLTLSITPFGQREPVNLPMAGELLLTLAGSPALNGCASFAIALDAAALEALDFGLRTYTTPANGGYARTARHRLLDLQTNDRQLSVTFDPLAPTDPKRTYLVPSAGPAIPSFLTSAAGPAWQASFGDDFRLVFTERLMGVDAHGHAVAAYPTYTTVPSGTLQLTLPPNATATGERSLLTTLMGGLSAVEVFQLPSAATLRFIPDQPAHAPQLPTTSAGAGPSFGPPTSAATTAWAAVVSPEAGTAYFSQADRAALHQQSTADSPFLTYLPLQMATLPTGDSQAFPLFPYRDVTLSGNLTPADLSRLERQVWSPRRLAILQPRPSGASAPSSPQPPTAAAPDPPFGTSRQGLLLRFGASAHWQSLTLAMSSPPAPKTRQPGLIVSNVSGALRTALQTNELFLVISSSDKFLQNCSIGYTLTSERVAAINAKLTDTTCQKWMQTLLEQGSTSFPDKETFTNTLLAPNAPSNMHQFLDIIYPEAGDFSLFAAGSSDSNAWEFDLSPYRWHVHQTILIIKFCNKALAEVAGEPSHWSSADDFNEVSALTAKQLSTSIADARSRQDSDSNFSDFINNVVDSSSWNGILALNALVPLSGLPVQMSALATGIDPAQFKAHHVGVSMTPIIPTGSALSAAPSSIFAIVDYENDSSVASQDAYAFRVSLLRILINNSQVISFSSRIALLINELFGESTTTQNNAQDKYLSFNGTYQTNGTGGPQDQTVGSYRFVTSGPTVYSLASGVLDQVGIVSGTFVTLPSKTATDGDINALFQLDGTIAFRAQSDFDLFSFGRDGTTQTQQGLSFRSLLIGMNFNTATPSYRTFNFDASKLILDIATSHARAGSLVSHFPMRLTALLQGQGNVTPDSLGFMPVDMPIQGSSLSAPWFGLRFDLDLGTSGALAAATGFTAGLLLGWSPNKSSTAIYCGLSLPGVSGGQRGITLEGILTLSFSGLKFVAKPPSSYLLQLTNITLKVLNLSFPPDGQVSMTLFGNPSQEKTGPLGWLAAYVKSGASGLQATQQPSQGTTPSSPLGPPSRP